MIGLQRALQKGNATQITSKAKCRSTQREMVMNLLGEKIQRPLPLLELVDSVRATHEPGFSLVEFQSQKRIFKRAYSSIKILSLAGFG
jgi:hypothetical protein